MIRNLLRTAALLAPLAVLLPGAAGCMAEADLPPPAYADGTEPLYYNNSVVYYDDGGAPYYWRGGERVNIAVGDPLYAGYAAHYARYGGAYRTWAAGNGARYRGYRGRGGRR